MTTQVTGSGVNFNGSTSGTILLTQPAVAGSNTITLPAETGTARTTVSSGTVLQVVNYQTGAFATGTTIIPIDNTIPQITEGNEYMTLAITPKSATSKLVIAIVVQGSINIAEWASMALFQDATANALACGWNYLDTATAALPLTLTHYMTSGTTSSTTFRVRIGTSAGNTFSINGQSAARFGGTLASSITITEVVP